MTFHFAFQDAILVQSTTSSILIFTFNRDHTNACAPSTVNPFGVICVTDFSN
jgi:hypothetical protein